MSYAEGGGLYKAPTKEERKQSKSLRGERGNIKFANLRFERYSCSYILVTNEMQFCIMLEQVLSEKI